MFNFHSVTINSVLRELKSSTKGLETKEAKRRLAQAGPNSLAEQKRLSSLEILWDQFKSPLIYILLVAGVISLLLQEYIDAGVIFGAVFINTIIGFFQENKANNALSKLKKMVEHKAVVMRDGQEQEVASQELVLGDLLLIRAGDRIPADARLLVSNELQVNEATLTGEAVAVLKKTDPVDKGAALADRHNMIYAGTDIVNGHGQAVITAIGNRTEIGQISQLVKDTKEEKTPLQQRLSRLSKYLGLIVTLIALLVVVVGIWQGRAFFEMFIVGVALAVAAVPEGLVVAVTVILILGMQQILKQKALVRKLLAAETLGSTTVICTDKTGTLTQGHMSVAHIIVGEKEFEIDSLGSRQAGVAEAKHASLALQIGMMCNDAIIENQEQDLKDWHFLGLPTEKALLSAAISSGLDRQELLKLEPRVDEKPFSSETKYMITLHERKRSYVIYEKGAPEILLEKASHFYDHGAKHALTKAKREKLIGTYESLTKRGLRLIGVAVREIKKDQWDPQDEKRDWSQVDNKLTFVGFIALKDPLRPDAKETIRICKQAGIRPIIITGDHKLTAGAIAKEVGLKVDAKSIVTGEALDKIDDQELRDLVKKVNVYARVSPHHKLRIVQALQENGEVVAMTGDGVNDSPALKAADIGVCLGSGTDISKETADLVLLDNNFKVIVSAVEQGRVIFNNIRKVITYLISDSFTEVILIAGSIMFGLPLAILPTQILWINIVNDGLPTFSLAFEKGNPNTMKRKPIKKNENILNKEMKMIIFAAGITRDIIIFAIFLFFLELSHDMAYIHTMVFAMVGVDSLMYIFSLRSFSRPVWKLNPFKNMYLIFASVVSFGLLLIAVYWPPLQRMLSTTALTWLDWGVIFFVGVMSVLMIEAVKFFFMPKNHD